MTVPDKRARTPLRSRSGFLYRPAVLFESTTRPWHVQFYTTDAFNIKLIRKRVLKKELNEIPSVDKRRRFAVQAIADINAMLYNDWHTESVDRAPALLKFDFRHFTWVQAIDYVASFKREVEGVRPKTIKEYTSTKTTVIDFLMHEKVSREFLLREINALVLRRYFDYLKQVRKLANKTYNGRRAILHSVFTVLLERDPKLFHGKNPVKDVKMLKTGSKKHAAYTDEQLGQIRDAMLKGSDAHLVFFIQVMFYTLARPEELRHLKIGDIDLTGRRILFRGEVAKTGVEQHVGINDSFAAILEEQRVTEFPANFYLFSNNGFHGGWGRKEKSHIPGPDPVASSYFYKRIRPYINELGFRRINANYTIYSFKHTGAIALYRATRDIKLVQSQCRHQSIEQTNVYLRDLGALSDFDQLNKWKGPI
jgi:integrase